MRETVLDTDEMESTQIDDLGPGSFVGEYRIEGLLGEGGMGRVYAAVHPVIAKRAAVKILKPELSKNREAVDRFGQEARAVNRIGHPNIVDIFAFGQLPDGRSYYVMELLIGESLRDRMKRAEVPILEAISILDSIAIALGAAHAKGVVHRDLKPDNVFLAETNGSEPQVKLLDFGIAKLLSQDTKRVERTQTGSMLGTPAYISPEQARGHSVDHRTDLYALGALGFELVTGRLPFPADNAAEMLAMHLIQPPPSARSLVPAVPASLDGLFVWLMAKDAGHRPTLDQTRDHLRAVRDQVAYGVTSAMQTAVPEAAPRRWWRLSLALAALVAIGIGVGVFFGVTDQQQPALPPAQAASAPPASTPPASAPPASAPPANPPPPVAAAVAPAPLLPVAAGSAVAPAKPVATSLAAAQTGSGSQTAPARTPKRPVVKKATTPRLPSRPTSTDDDDAPM